MNSNWSRLKRKLNENKQNNYNRHKRRRLNEPTANTITSNKNHKRSRNKHNKSFLTKYSNSPSSNEANTNSFDTKIENYRKNTSKKQLFDVINLFPPSSTDNDMERRKAFWNDLRLKLRSRLPKEFLFKIITPLNEVSNPQISSKLHEIKASSHPTNTMAMDCEMVGVGNKSVLSRISIVNFNGEVVYDKFVKPKNDPQCNNITDYREEITGITKHDLLNYGISFEKAQKDIILILKGRKVVGHAINNDFAVIKCANILKHNYYSTITTAHNDHKISKRKTKKLEQKKRSDSWFFDTAKCELLHDDINRPRSLKFLLELYLGIHIQSNEHDSVIDAISTMAIYRAVLPEIKERKREKKVEKKKEDEKKKKWTERKQMEREKRKAIQKNRNVLNNYAYDNTLDKLIAQFDGAHNIDNKKGDTDKELFSNPYHEV